MEVNRHVSTDKIHKDRGIQKLEDRRRDQLAAFMFKQAQKLDLRPTENQRTRGDLKIKFKLKRHYTEKFKKSPLYRGVMLWKRIKLKVPRAKSLASFKTEYAKTSLKNPVLLR